jgi:L-asparaginase
MQQGSQGFEPAPGFLFQRMNQVASLLNDDMPNFEVKEYQPLIDSADSSPELWNRIAADIREVYEDYDGFLILHGTDTMAYTASALAFLLQGLTKPIMLTGSQVPLCFTQTDARDNLINALYLLEHYPVPEVTVYFNHCLFRGARVTKVNAASYRAFTSPNFPPLIKVTTQVKKDPSLQEGFAKISLPICEAIKPLSVAFFPLFPGVGVEQLNALKSMPLQALIIKSYGVGNAPTQDKALLQGLKELSESGVVLINSSLCLHAKVCMQHYQTGQVLSQCGAISALDMTDEALLCKLYYLFSLDLSLARIKELLSQNLVGELTR